MIRVRPFRTAPVTAECLIVCAALFAICYGQTADGLKFLDAQRQWGAALTLHMIPGNDGPLEPIHRQLQGPFDLWDGEWWRIPVNSFHHVNALHLLVNSLSAWMLGRRLEQRWGSLRYAIFLVPAVLIPILLEFLVGTTAMGFSGVICAMLGALMVLQNVAPREDDIPAESIQFMLGFIVLGIPATALDLLPVGNVAHFSGIVYGWTAAWIFGGPGSRFMMARLGFVAAHVLLIPGLWLATHPVNSGCYYWYLAVDRTSRIGPFEREPLLRRAIQADPSLTGVWLRLANQRIVEGNLQGAWSLLVDGLSHNPSDSDLFAAVRSTWERMPIGDDRDAAERELRRAFGDQAPLWSRQIRETRRASAGDAIRRSGKSKEPELDPRDFPLDRPLDLQWEPKQQVPLHPPIVDPERLDSAAEGTAL